MIEIFKVRPDAKLPVRHHKYDCGADVFANEDVFIKLGETKRIPLGIAVNVPENWCCEIKDRSSMGLKGLKVLGGIVDPAYTNELSVILSNLTCNETKIYGWSSITEGYKIEKGQRIAQLIFYKVELPGFIQTNQMWIGDRGLKGLGSSGK